MALANCGIQKIETFLSDGPFFIPNYQRDYSWEVEVEIKDFWDDLENVLKEDMDEFFLGQMVIHNDKTVNKKYLIDGQQRTTTLVMFFVALRNLFLKMKVDYKDYPNEETITNIEESEREISSMLQINKKSRNKDKLILGDDYKDFFREKILYSSHNEINQTKSKNSTEKKLISCYKAFYNYLCSYIDENGVEVQYDLLDNLYTTITSRFKVLYVETDDESEAFLIFETLNARGRDLETSDLLKNYFFRRSSGNITKVKENWAKMVDAFSGENITNYIRCFWNSQHEFCREKLLYKKISKNISTPSDCLKMTSLLAEYSKVFLNLTNPYDNHFFKQSNLRDEYEEILENLYDLKIKTFYSVILSYYDQHKHEDETTLLKGLIQLVQLIEKIIIRDIVISKRSPAHYEVVFASLSKMIYENVIIEMDQVNDYLKSNSINDNEFKNNFLLYAEPKGTTAGKNKIRYLLRNIINYKTKETVIKRNNDEVHIEHIMPVTIGEWKIDEEEHNSHLWRLGNLILLDSKLNQEMQNDLYEKKRTYYLNSSIQMNKNLANDYSKWGINEIEDRQTQLYEIAKELWLF